MAITSLLLVYATAQLGGIRAVLERWITDTLTGYIQIKPVAAPRDFFDYPPARRLAVVSAADLDAILDKLKSISAVEAASLRRAEIMMPVIDAGNILLGLAVLVVASLLTTLASRQDAVALLDAKY